jgi:acetoin utilization protein AcuB
MSMLTIDDVMTPQPFTIGREQTLAVAHAMMDEHGIRHLPVLEQGEIVGILSQRDLFFLETIAGVNLGIDRVDDAMTQDVYAVGPEARVPKVAHEMAEHRYGCAVVMERERVIGIFTATDALRLLAAKPKPKPKHARVTAKSKKKIRA